ncbi:MAG: hypothetical protein F9K29_06525 [Hyphomicrobiaceae bacterium]|nr:MAG: hypothetical protein F9K29_06525 [Hyphomicrobiaceae bacterium]
MPASPTLTIPAPPPRHGPSDLRSLADIEARIDELAERPGDPGATVRELLALGEEVLEHWLFARGETPTREEREGFRLLALHRQGAKGEPSFNACRETCRELVYHHNLIMLEPSHPDRAKRTKLAAMIAKHLCLFVSGKMQVAGLGEFCCAAKPLRSGDDQR